MIGNLGPGIGRCGIHKKSLRKEFGNNRKGRSPANRAQAQSRPGRAAGENREEPWFQDRRRGPALETGHLRGLGTSQAQRQGAY